MLILTYADKVKKSEWYKKKHRDKIALTIVISKCKHATFI